MCNPDCLQFPDVFFISIKTQLIQLPQNRDAELQGEDLLFDHSDGSWERFGEMDGEDGTSGE
jgi:hypothetical protein